MRGTSRAWRLSLELVAHRVPVVAVSAIGVDAEVLHAAIDAWRPGHRRVRTPLDIASRISNAATQRTIAKPLYLSRSSGQDILCQVGTAMRPPN